MPPVYRLLKQSAYGALYLALAAGLLAGTVILIQLALVTPAPLPAIALPSPLRIEQVTSVRHGKTIDLIARLRNPNPDVGIRSVTGTFHMLAESGTEIASHSETTYILPGMIQYLIAIDVPDPGSFARVELTLNAPVTAVLPDTLTLPSFATFLRARRQFTSGSRQIEEQTGLLRNTSSLDWERIEIIGLALDAQAAIVGVSQTFLGGLKGGSQLEFTLQWPAPTSATSRVIIWPTTNIFEETNIIKVIGDPASLR